MALIDSILAKNENCQLWAGIKVIPVFWRKIWRRILSWRSRSSLTLLRHSILPLLTLHEIKQLHSKDRLISDNPVSFLARGTLCICDWYLIISILLHLVLQILLFQFSASRKTTKYIFWGWAFHKVIKPMVTKCDNFLFENRIMLNGTKPCAVNLIIEKNSDIFSQNQKGFGCFVAAVLWFVFAFFKELIWKNAAEKNFS